jgi:hypothetical protein
MQTLYSHRLRGLGVLPSDLAAEILAASEKMTDRWRIHSGLTARETSSIEVVDEAQNR